MTEYEKMKAGRLYQFDAEVLEKMYRGHELADAFNRTAARDGETRKKILTELLDAPEDLCIEPPFHCDFGENIHIGHNFFANFGCTILDGADVTIGDRVLLGPNVSIYTAEHVTDYARRAAGDQFTRPVTIGDDTWIGGSAVILSGVTIGKRCIVAAGSVVVHDVPDDTLVGGNPAHVLKKLQE